MARNFGADEIGGLAFTGLTFGMLSALDDESSDYLHKKFGDSGYFKVTNEFGTITYVAPASAALFGVSLLTDDQKFQDAAFTSIQSVLYTAAVVNVIKFGVARARPVQEEGSRDIDLFQLGHSSFPSGHTSTAFAVFVPWVVYYPNVATYAMLAIPLSTSVARIADQRHWLTDVTAGAIIGTYIGYKLARNHLNESEERKIAVNPFVVADGGGLRVSLNF